MTVNASSCCTATSFAIVQQRTEQFLKEACEETWIFSLTRKWLGGKERRLGFLRLHQYFKELFNTTSHVCVAHPLAVLRKQLLPLLFLKWLMLQVNVLPVSIPSYEGLSGQACTELFNISQDEEISLIYRTWLWIGPLGSQTHSEEDIATGFLVHSLVILNPLKSSFRHLCPLLSLLWDKPNWWSLRPLDLCVETDWTYRRWCCLLHQGDNPVSNFWLSWIGTLLCVARRYRLPKQVS